VQSPCILVVDDVEASATTLGMMLKGIGQDVATANDGQSAITRALAFRPDIAFLDIAMPEMSGYEVARHFKEHDELKQIVLVALTGYGQQEDRKKTKEAGFTLHLVKPATIDELAQVLLSVPGAE
jgi:CheY-like chemotaxis protein